MVKTKDDYFEKLLKKFLPKFQKAIETEIQLGQKIVIENAKDQGSNTQDSGLLFSKKDMDKVLGEDWDLKYFFPRNWFNTGHENECTVTCEADGDSDDYSVSCNDCDDGDPDRVPGNTEVCDNKDNNCDDNVDEGFTNEDCQYVCQSNSYTWTNNGGSLNCCGNDANEGDYEATEASCSDGNDNDCDGEWDYDTLDRGADGNVPTKGDNNCAVGVTAISVSDDEPVENTDISVTCTVSVSEVNSIQVFIGTTECVWDSVWETDDDTGTYKI